MTCDLLELVLVKSWIDNACTIPITFLMYHSFFQSRIRMICGRLEIIVGPMFAGKSTELIRRVNRHTTMIVLY